MAGQTNKFQVTVTAEDGTKKTYNLNIIRLAEESTVPNVIDEEIQKPVETKLMLTSLVIKDVDISPEFNSEVYNYVANVQNIKELEIDATASKPEAQINIEGATDLKEGENTVKIIITLGDEKVEYVIQVHNTLQEEIAGITEENNSDSNNGSNLKQILLILMIGLLGIIAIRYIIVSYKLNAEIEELTGIEPVEDEYFGVKNQNIKIEDAGNGRHF